MQSKLEPLAVSTTEAARLLNVSRPTLYTLLNQADFPSFRIGSRVLINVSALKSWVDKQTERSGDDLMDRGQ